MSIHVAEAEFESRLRQFVQQSLSDPGTLGVQMLHPAPGDEEREYGILRSFASQADRDAFYASPSYLGWQREIGHLVKGEAVYRDLHGLEAWFHHDGMPRPPRWKMALVTWLGVYPTSLVLGLLVAPHVHALPRALSALIISGCMVVCLTWLVMPLVTRVLHPWLQPKE